MDPIFITEIKRHLWSIGGSLLNNSVHLNLLCLELLSTESKTAEYHAASNMVDWSARVIESIFGYLEVYIQVSFKR